MNERFEIPARLRLTSIVLILVGLITLIIGAVVLLNSGSGEMANFDKIRFWDVLLHNSLFFTVVSAACIFIMAAASLAQGGWIVAYRRVPEAIGANVWLFGAIFAVIMFLIAFTFRIKGANGLDFNPIYPWMTPNGDKIIEGKAAFLNPSFFVIYTLAALGLWSFFGIRFRNMSVAQDRAPRNSTKTYWTTVTFSGIFLLVYALTQMSVTPWLWTMSIDTHWYSTMFSWYSFASAFVSAMALILMWVVYLKNQGYMQIVNREHIHDLGKFMFAFSIFWTYVWFAQFMLIWYGNIPEETTYFKIRMQGPYSLIWFAVFIICFIMPILILMSRPSKRNYFTVSFMALVIIFGHWLDYYQMIMPGTLKQHWHMNWYELGILAGFIGLQMWAVSRTLAKAPLVPGNHPLLKETVVHLS